MSSCGGATWWIGVAMILASTVACDREPLEKRLQPDLEGDRAEVVDSDRSTAERASASGVGTLERPGGGPPSKSGSGSASADHVPDYPSVLQLRRYSKARSAVVAINEKYAAKMASVAHPQEADSLRREASAEMVDVVHEAGLSTSEYSDIAALVQRDPMLQRKVLDHTPD